MGARLGMHHAGYDYSAALSTGRSTQERAIIREAGIYATKPLVPTQEWEKLVDYLISAAPDRLAVDTSPPKIGLGIEIFQAKTWSFSHDTPTTTLVEIDEERHEVLVGDMLRQSLSVLDSAGRLKQELQLGDVPVAVRRQRDQLWITTIGSMVPSDDPKGGVVRYEKAEDQYRFYPGNRILEKLIRPVYASYADLNDDGIEDIVVSEFGHHMGRFAWYEGTGTSGTFTRHVLLKEPGSMSSRLHDFNDDGLTDLAVIVGQNREGVFIFINEGDGEFRPSYAVQLPPVYGSSHLGLHDFNDDGFVDLLITNGDNGDYEAILKPYHGIRIYINDGKNAFSEAFFFPQNGAYKAIAEDFDQDGDLDIASVAMFADYEHRPQEGFIYLENQGNLQFEAFSIAQVDEGRWITLDAGDLDGDGDKDIILGSYVTALTPVPDRFTTKWQSSRLPVLYLENQLK